MLKRTDPHFRSSAKSISRRSWGRQGWHLHERMTINYAASLEHRLGSSTSVKVEDEWATEVIYLGQ
jgi:hypothetical protein